MKREIYSSDDAPAAIGPYSQACGFGQLVFLSGQIALTADGKDYTDRPVEEQCRIALRNLQAVLEASGCSLESVLKVTIFLIDMADFPIVNAVYSEFFTQNPPARACVAVSQLPRGANIELDCIAVRESSSVENTILF